MPLPPLPSATSRLPQNDLGPGTEQRRMSFGSEIALQHGVHFEGKYIGSMEITRPGTRIEIVAAMRRVRYEFKARNIKKRPVDIVVSVDGVKVVLQRRRKRQKCMDESKMMVMSHPMYRIYYVAHDLYDPLIFCYVARDGASNSFKCNVFKCLERDQAIAVVRTIGQAFELCNRMSQEQTRERQLMEEERAMEATAGGSGTVAAVAGTSSGAKARESLASDADRHRSSSPSSGHRHTSPAAKRQSIFMPKRVTAAEEEEEEEGEQRAGDGDDEQDEEPDNDSVRDSFDQHQPGPSSSSAHHHRHRRSSIQSAEQFRSGAGGLQLNIPPAATEFPATVAQQQQMQQQQQQQNPVPQLHATSHPLHSQPLTAPLPTLWNIPATPQQLPPLFGTGTAAPAQLVQSVAANGNALFSIVPPPTALSLSPLLISPYATLQLPPSTSLASTSSGAGVDLQQLQSPNSESAQRMIRSQLEQAQQSAQVAACQVQLLRDQLSTETTARLEAQSKTHQLLNSNRELLEQVQQLVNRLQLMENRMAAGLMNHLGGSRNDVRRRRDSRPEAEEASSSAAGAAALPELRPYQLKTLSDLRSGSLPAGEDEAEGRKRGRARSGGGIGGGRSAESAAEEEGPSEDEEEYSTEINLPERALLDFGAPSSSTTALAAPPVSASFLRKLVPAVPPTCASPPASSASALALGMPLLFGPQINNRYASSNPPGRRKPQAPQMADSTAQSQQRHMVPNDIGTSSKKALRRFSLQPTELEPDPHQQRVKKGGGSKGVFGKMEFKRMSFNPNPNKKVAEDKSLISVPPINAVMEGASEELYATERRNSRSSPEKKLGSPERSGGRRRSSLGGLSRLLAPSK